jgi:alpha-tubulin suppressor-like RCC1 family protein
VSAGPTHALALAEDGLVYAWGENAPRMHPDRRALLGNAEVDYEVTPTPVEALRGVRVGSIAAAGLRSYAVADTGELWAWGAGDMFDAPLGHAEQMHCLPKPIESVQGAKVDAVVAGKNHMLARADDGSVYAWGDVYGDMAGALGLGRRESGPEWEEGARTPQRVPAVRVA